jgi:hypothetical protein
MMGRGGKGRSSAKGFGTAECHVDLGAECTADDPQPLGNGGDDGEADPQPGAVTLLGDSRPAVADDDLELSPCTAALTDSSPAASEYARITALVAASVTASFTSATPSASMPQSAAMPAISRRSIRTPKGVPGNLASNGIAMRWAYPSAP